MSILLSLSQILSSNQIALTKLYKFDNPNLWAPEPGPLKLVAVNTGAGRLMLNPDDGGVVIAEVQADLDGHGVTVENHESLDIYQSTKSIKIAGSGFADSTKASEGRSTPGLTQARLREIPPPLRPRRISGLDYIGAVSLR